MIVYRLSYLKDDKYNRYHLVIKDINLDTYFDENTTLNDGIEMHPSSFNEGMPIILSGHSGVGKNIYFNDLNKLNIGDSINLKYKDNTTNYEVVDISFFMKFTDVSIPKDDNYLYLVTCDTENSEKQLIITAKKSKI